MSEWKWVFWNLSHGPTEKDDLIRELRRELTAVKARELELRRGDWVMLYYDMRRDRDRWRKIADNLVSGAEQQIDELRKPGDKNTNAAWLGAWHDYDQAVTDEQG